MTKGGGTEGKGGGRKRAAEGTEEGNETGRGT